MGMIQSELGLQDELSFNRTEEGMMGRNNTEQTARGSAGVWGTERSYFGWSLELVLQRWENQLTRSVGILVCARFSKYKFRMPS